MSVIEIQKEKLGSNKKGIIEDDIKVVVELPKNWWSSTYSLSFGSTLKVVE